MTRGSIAWFARNGVAANLIMVLVIVGGALTVGLVDGVLDLAKRAVPAAPIPEVGSLVKQEVFPEFSLDLITVTVPYLGAAPEEVEEAVCVRIEEAIQGLDGVKEIRSTASEGVGIVVVELTLDADAARVLDDVKSRVDAIDTFPEETEQPIVRELTNRREVLSLAVWGDAGEKVLRELAERIRDDVVALPGITVAELANARPYEVSIEISEDALRRYGLSFDEVATAVRRTSLDLPGGSIKTDGGEILLRTTGEAQLQHEFERLVVRTQPDGTLLRVADVATVIDGFEDTDQLTRFNGKPAQVVQIFRIGDQDALSITAEVYDYVAERADSLPAGVQVTPWNDASRILRDRRDLLLRNAAFGIVLVFLALALFLRFRLAIWVVVGMFISFMGAIWLMPVLGVSVNLISLFAFILVLGIVVDDAIVAGENIATTQRRTGKGLEGSIAGAQEVSVPVVFAVLTTVAAFTPLLGVPGTTGKVMRVIPLIVIPCLLWSLVESLWVLPAHLSHYRPHRGSKGPWRRFQGRFSDGLHRVIAHVYSPILEKALEYRYVTVAIGLATVLVTAGLVGGGVIGFVFFPDVEADFISATLTMPPGTPAERTSLAIRQLENAARETQLELEREYGVESLFKYRVTSIGSQPFSAAQRQNAGLAATAEKASHLGEMTIELAPAERRPVSSAVIVDRWRERTGRIPDAIELSFTASLFSPGDDVNVQLTGPDIDELRDVADDLKARLAVFDGVFEISDSFRPGKEELQLDIKPGAEVAGLRLVDLGRQVRAAFYGDEAQRIQRGRDDVRVMVRYPESERRSLADVENMRIRLPDGTEVPFSEVASVRYGRGFSTITRVDRRRAINVTADVDETVAKPGEIIAELESDVLPAVLRDHPRVRYSFEGQQAEQRETLGGLLRGFVIALLGIYALLAVPLRSYAQPLLIMAAIPFGFVGAIWGHWLLGLDLTILSMFGFVALAGVVVNDSLVMVDFINNHRRSADELHDAVRNAGVARFRAILLTSLTTFAGLAPLMLERSMQARFLIPMAVSLSFGVLFATFITLVLVPSGYVILVDVQNGVRRLLGRDAIEAGAEFAEAYGDGRHGSDASG